MSVMMCDRSRSHQLPIRYDLAAANTTAIEDVLVFLTACLPVAAMLTMPTRNAEAYVYVLLANLVPA